MRLMKYVMRRGRIFYVVVPVPPGARHAFGGSQQKWVSLKTDVEREAFRLAPPVINELLSRIDQALERAPPAPAAVTPTSHVRLNPDAVLAAIERWRRAEVQEAYELHFSGLAEIIPPMSAEAVALDELRYSLRTAAWSEVAGLDERLVACLRSQGLDVTAEHPAIPNLRAWFGEAWLSVEDYTQAFREGRWSVWPEEGEDVRGEASPTLSLRENTPEEPSKGSASPKQPLTLSGLLERFLAHERLGEKEDREARYYVRRLSEFLGGDVLLTEITTPRMRDFLVELRKFPKTRDPSVTNLTFQEIVSHHAAGDRDPRLAAKTIRTKWFQTYLALFAFGVSEGALGANPVANAMPKKRDDLEVGRERYDAADIAAMFSRPMFVGHEESGRGYRTQAGSVVLRDHKFWLPIFALWHGCRVEEIASAACAEVKEVQGVWCLDLRDRPVSRRRGEKRKGVKSEDSRRLLPIHPRLVAGGFVQHVEARRAEGAKWVFPELPHDPKGEKASSRNFTKWWGHWCRENADQSGAGFDDPAKTFHSFRHSFVTACRGVIDVEIRNFLTGHSGGGVGAKYGDAEAPMLYEQLARVEYPTFPPEVLGGA